MEEVSGIVVELVTTRTKMDEEIGQLADNDAKEIFHWATTVGNTGQEAHH